MATNPTRAPSNDLTFMKNLVECEAVDEDVRKVAFKKFKNHLWYLGEELIGLAFFDPKISIQCKRKMVQNILTNNGTEGNKLKYASAAIEETIIEMTIYQFVTKSTMKFFEKLKINTEFLRNDPSTWPNCDNYPKALEFVQYLHVVNDAAERAVALMKHLNLKSKSEEEIQAMCHIVREHQKFSPSCTKNSLNGNFAEHIFNN